MKPNFSGQGTPAAARGAMNRIKQKHGINKTSAITRGLQLLEASLLTN